jgi:hypothetical protein
MTKKETANKKESGTPADALSLARTQAACGTRHGVRRLAPPSACGRVRLPAFHLRFSPTGLSSRGLSFGPGFPRTMRKLRRAARITLSHSDAPRAPVIVPAGMMPEPPGSGVYLSARGHRTRSAFAEYPRRRLLLRERDSVTVLTETGTRVNGNVTAQSGERGFQQPLLACQTALRI